MTREPDPRSTRPVEAGYEREPGPGDFDPANPEHVGMRHRYLPDPRDPLADPERRQTVDNYEEQVRGRGADADDGRFGLD